MRWKSLTPTLSTGAKIEKEYRKFLNEIGLPTKCIAIEITEGLLLDDRPEVAAIGALLRRVAQEEPLALAQRPRALADRHPLARRAGDALDDAAARLARVRRQHDVAPLPAQQRIGRQTIR